jgi:hypothetical protein
MDPVWTLLRRRLLTSLRYWLTPLGYDLRDRSLSNRLYLLYFCAFWSVWALAVFSILGSGLAQLLGLLDVNPGQAVVAAGEYGLMLWGVAMLCQVSTRSPFIFSEQDAYLLCQSPVSRGKVGLAWFLQALPATLLPLVAAAVVLAFALTELRLQGGISPAIIVEYLTAAARAVFLVLPAIAGWQSGWWALGALRLQAAGSHRHLFMLLGAAAGLLLAACLFTAPYRLAVSPFYLTLGAAFMGELQPRELWGGLGFSLLVLAGGLALLYKASAGMSLDRAAQETRQRAALDDARRYGQLDLLDAILLRRRLGAARAPSRLLARARTQPLPWKDALQYQRGFRPRDLAGLALLCVLSAGMFMSSSWGLQMLAAGIWTFNMSALGARRLRSDLGRWWLFRSLPLPAAQLLKGELLFGWALATLTGWLGLALSGRGFSSGLLALLLLPLLAGNAAMAAASDILRQSQGSSLMAPSLGEENVPRPGFWGQVQALASVLLPFGILIWASGSANWVIGGAAAFAVAALVTWLNRRSLLSAYRWVR